MNSLLIRLSDVINKAKVNEYYASLLKSQYYSKTELVELQHKLLMNLLIYVKKNIPFYSIFLKDVDLNKLSELSVEKILQNLPLTDKLFIKEHFNEWKTLNKNAKLVQVSTSGSTGTPFKFGSSWDNFEIKRAGRIRMQAWHGVKRGAKQLCIQGNPYAKTLTYRLKEFLNKIVMSRKFFNSVELHDEGVIKCINLINTMKPVMLDAYPSSLVLLANYSLKNKVHIDTRSIKLIEISGESHSKQDIETIKKVFGKTPYDEYCTTEGFIAGCCEEGKLHLSEDTLIAEILDEHGNIVEFGRGELILTYLYSFDFPFIRYNTGDIVEITQEQCECGRNLKVIRNIDGRSTTYILNGNEKITEVSCTFYITKTKYLDYIERWQLKQTSETELEMRIIVKDKSVDFVDFEHYVSKLFNHLHVNFIYVDNIPFETSGKFRVVINTMKV